MEFKGVSLLGRTLDECCAYLQLEGRVFRSGRILDLGAGISSFCAEAAACGYDVAAADPIYRSSSEDIAEKSQADLADVLLQLPGAAHKYNWTYYRNPDDLAQHRESARRRFLEDYSQNRSRYVTSSLPNTGFADNEFAIVLVSYFLFLYDDLFDYEFHKQSVLELARIAQREVRIYPLANMRAVRSSILERLIEDPDCSALTFDVLKSNFEFLKNSNELLIIPSAEHQATP